MARKAAFWSALIKLSSLIEANMLEAHSDNYNDSPGDILSLVGSNQSFAFHLLYNDKIYTNLTQMLNISVDNLTTLLTNVHNTNLLLEQQLHTTTGIPKSLLATLTVCYGLIFVAGILGNLITCVVISRNNFMHTATNFYLFNLAVSDLILLLSGMPQELYNLWYPDSYPFTDVICIMGSVLAETAANATVLTITAFTVERYIAICHPFRQHTMSKLSRAIKFIFAIWLMALLLALPQAIQFSVIPQAGGYSCTMENDFYAHVFAVSGFIFFGGPMTAICVLYVLIGVKLKRSRLLQSLPRRSYDINRGLNAQSRVIRMLVAVAVAFFLCWAPFHAQRLMAVYGLSLINIGFDKEDFHDYFRILDYTSGVLYFLSTCINPLLYNIMSHKFREAFRITLTHQFGLSSKHQNQNHNYSALLRQNGSMRVHTTVNNNALENFGSYRVVQFRCRDPSHHLSLQDSIRTTTTTTTINSMAGSACGCGVVNSLTTSASIVGGGDGSRQSSYRTRCLALVAHTPNRKDELKQVTHLVGKEVAHMPHRTLQTQISQLSSVGNASSLLGANVDEHYSNMQTSASYRLKRSKLLSTHNNGSLVLHQAMDATHCNPRDELELSEKPCDESSHVTRSRLKLSCIISRREVDGNTCTKVKPNVELRHEPTSRSTARTAKLCLATGNVLHNQPKGNKKIENFAEKLHLRSKKHRRPRSCGLDGQLHRIEKPGTSMQRKSQSMLSDNKDKAEDLKVFSDITTSRYYHSPKSL